MKSCNSSSDVFLFASVLWISWLFLFEPVPDHGVGGSCGFHGSLGCGFESNLHCVGRVGFVFLACRLLLYAFCWNYASCVGVVPLISTVCLWLCSYCSFYLYRIVFMFRCFFSEIVGWQKSDLFRGGLVL